MDAETLIARNKSFVLDILILYKSLPKSSDEQIIGRQLVRSSTSTAANYRAVCRARSDAEFLAKLNIVVEEIDESNFWLDILIDSGISDHAQTKKLLDESLELLKIYSASKKTTKFRK